MLATAAGGVHNRKWLQEMLWSRSGTELGRSSLRRALSDLRRIFGADFDQLFEITNIDVTLRPDRIRLLGDSRDGLFLEGVDILEDGFQDWLAEKRLMTKGGAFETPSLVLTQIAPSVAVIPFMSRRDDPAERRFSDFAAHEITRTLSRSTMIDVISHLSSRQFEGRLLNLQTIDKTLGADYVVYGTAQADNDAFTIEADFADVRTGRVHWTRRYDGSIGELTAGSSDTIEAISRRIGQTILLASVELSRTRPLPDVESHALFMSAIMHMHEHVRSHFIRAREELEEVIKRASDHSLLYAWMGKWHVLAIAQGWSENPAHDLKTASELASRALSINPNCSFSLAIDGMVQHDISRDFTLASKRFTDALENDPNNAFAWLLNARLHAFVGNGVDAVKCAQRACALSPIDPHKYFFDSLTATAHVANEDYEQALRMVRRSLAANSRHASSHRVYVVTLSLMGREAEAERAAGRLLELEPTLTVENYLESHPAAEFQNGRIWADALKNAGVPTR
ncbi:MAG: tetratricopeptide repeat protein [Pseudomonadota bacterium]